MFRFLRRLFGRQSEPENPHPVAFTPVDFTYASGRQAEDRIRRHKAPPVSMAEGRRRDQQSAHPSSPVFFGGDAGYAAPSSDSGCSSSSSSSDSGGGCDGGDD